MIEYRDAMIRGDGRTMRRVVVDGVGDVVINNIVKMSMIFGCKTTNSISVDADDKYEYFSLDVG